MAILKLTTDTLVELKKPHPCGKRVFRIIRVGSLCRIRCESCGRELEIDRVRLEGAIRRFVSEDAS